MIQQEPPMKSIYFRFFDLQLAIKYQISLAHSIHSLRASDSPSDSDRLGWVCTKSHLGLLLTRCLVCRVGATAEHADRRLIYHFFYKLIDDTFVREKTGRCYKQKNGRFV